MAARKLVSRLLHSHREEIGDMDRVWQQGWRVDRIWSSATLQTTANPVDWAGGVELQANYRSPFN